MFQEIYQLRKDLHRHPELSGEETSTALRIRDFIRHDHDTEIISGIGGNGLAVIYSFPGEGPVVMIRCELDALPIEEANDFAHRSVNTGVSHKCGHDGHMAILSGLALWLREQHFKKGKLILLFQPAEEDGRGALAVLNDSLFKKLAPDYIFALHNLPGFPLHAIVQTKDAFTATVQSFAIYLEGRPAHASEPENGINPGGAIADLIHSIGALDNNNPRDPGFALLTPIYSSMGEKAYGISAGKGELHYTLRAWTREVLEDLKNKITELTRRICEKHRVSFSIDWFDYFPASINDEYCNRVISQAAKMNGYAVIENSQPFRFGEDFGWFAQQSRAGMFGVGAGLETPALHHNDYDFPEEIIETGVRMLGAIVGEVLNRSDA